MFRSILFAFTALASNAPALASPQEVQFETRHVRYGDLDLSSDKGRATLERRVAIAVREVCGYATDFHDIAEERRIHRCRNETGAKAREQVASAVTKYNNRNQLALSTR